MKRILASVAILALILGAEAKKEDTKSLIGKAAPPIALKTTDDKDFNLADEKGNVVLLDFWATWCPPCRQSLPHLQAIHDDAKLKEKGLKVYAMNEGEEKEKAKAYCEQNKLSFPVALDSDNAIGKAYFVRGIPTTVVIGRDQKVKSVFIGFGPGSEEKIRAAAITALNAPKPSESAKAD